MVQVIIALVVVFFLFKIPCDGPVLLFVLLCLLQGDQFDHIANEDEDEGLFQIMLSKSLLRGGWDELRLLPLHHLRHNGRRDEDGHQLLLPRPHGRLRIFSLFFGQTDGQDMFNGP